MKTHKLSDLEIIGYANHLKAGWPPSMQAPVFRYLKSGIVLFPPFKIIEDHVEGGHDCCMNEAVDFAIKECITLWEDGPPVKPKPHYGLWVDSHLQVHYDPIAVAREAVKNG